ncbi:MAG: GNAT family N-acetyltransferase, partial [Beijerinckiaceae bacterium]
GVSGAPLIVRRLTEADAAAFRDIRLRSLRDHPEHYASTPEEWGEDLATYRERIAALPVIGAFADDRLVGTAILGVSARDKTKTRHKCEVWSVYTAPEARRRGIARDVMLHVIAEARQLGFEALVLCVTSHNTAGRKLYRSLGFQRFGTEPRHLKLPDGSYIDEDHMQLDLL